MSNVAQVETNVNETVGLPFKESMTDKCDTIEALEQDLLAEQIKGVVANALGVIAQSGSTDQLRGYANEAIGKTKLNIGLAVGSPQLVLLGIAQKAVGQAQRYIGEAKAATEAADMVEMKSVAMAVASCQDLPSVDERVFDEPQRVYTEYDKPNAA